MKKIDTFKKASLVLASLAASQVLISQKIDVSADVVEQANSQTSYSYEAILNDTNVDYMATVDGSRNDGLYSGPFNTSPETVRPLDYSGNGFDGHLVHVVQEVETTRATFAKVIDGQYYYWIDRAGLNPIYPNQIGTSEATQLILDKFGINATDLPPVGTERWPLEAGQLLTISYWVDPQQTIETKDGLQNYASLVQRAIDSWNSQLSAVGAPVQFVQAYSPESANYNFQVGENSTVVAGQTLSGLSGRTTMYMDKANHTYLIEYGINTFMNQSTISQYYTADQAVNVLAHEIGHSLGLEHTDNTSELMYTSPQNQVLRTVDAVAVLMMYTSENVPGKGTQQIFS